MIYCERCGTGFSPIRAAVLAHCPRCRSSDDILVPLITKVVKDPPQVRKNKDAA